MQRKRSHSHGEGMPMIQSHLTSVKSTCMIGLICRVPSIQPSIYPDGANIYKALLYRPNWRNSYETSCMPVSPRPPIKAPSLSSRRQHPTLKVFVVVCRYV